METDSTHTNKSALWRRAGALLKGGALFVALVVITWTCLAFLGVPQSVIGVIENRLLLQGARVKIDRLYLQPFSGLTARDIEVRVEEGDPSPVIRAKEARLRFSLRTWWKPAHGAVQIVVEECSVHWISGASDHDERSAPFHVDVLTLEMTWNADLIHVRHMELETAPLVVEGRGRLHRASPSARMEPKVDTPKPIVEEVDTYTRHVKTLLTEWQQVNMPIAGRVQFAFEYEPNNPDRTRVFIHGNGGNTFVRNMEFDRWKAIVRANGPTITVKEMRLERIGRALLLEGRYNMVEDKLQFQMKNDLLPSNWVGLLPAMVKKYKDKAGIVLDGETEWSLAYGPSPLRTSEYPQVSGSIRATDMDAHGVWLDIISLQVDFDGQRIDISDIDAQVRGEGGVGPAQGHISFDLESLRYEGALKASCDPYAVLPVAGYSRTANRIITALSFDEIMPEIDVVFSGQVAPDPSFNFSGTMRGTAFTYSGARLELFDTHMELNDRVFRIDPLLARRVEGELEGWYEQDFNRKIIDMEVYSEVHPHALGKIAGGTIERVLDHFHFKGSVSVEIAGRVDYGEHRDTHYRAIGSATRVGWDWITADHCKMEWIGRGDTITMKDVMLDFYGGSVTGSVTLEGIGEAPVAFSTAGRLSDVQFTDLLSARREESLTWHGGTMGGHFSISGWTEDWKSTLTGGGRVRIRDGQVFQIPLLGGLSDLLGRIYPRFGFATQTDARGDFELSDRHVKIPDVRVEGTLLSLRGHGAYDLDDVLDFRVQVQPLRRGRLVDAVRMFTYPVSRLLQFRLEGSLSDPEWRIENLPKELWGLFERSPVED